MTNLEHIYEEAYKPLRNYIRKLCIDDSLFVIWNYTQYLQFSKKFSKEIEVNPALLNRKDTKSWRPNEWELELLAKEIIINSQKICSSSISLKKWHQFYTALNKLRYIRDEVAKTYFNKDNVSTELYRIAHRQFPWQSRVDFKFLFRYYKIFSNSTINDIVQKILGISVRDLYYIGLAFIAIYLEKPEILLPLQLDLEKLGINLDKVNKFLNFTSESLSTLKDKIIEEQEFNDRFEYTYNPMRAFPIIKMPFKRKDSLVCPMVTLLFWRITSGLYYEICDEKDFGDNFGHSFQKYIGKVIEKANKNKAIKFMEEEEYHVGRNRKDTVDWIVYDKDSALFIECKARRISLRAKIELRDNSIIVEELEKMVEIILQIYKTIDDYCNNLYPSFKYEEGRQIYPIIITMENWFLFGDKRQGILDKMIIEEFDNINLPIDYLKKMPYSICSVQDFEGIIQVMQITHIKKFMDRKVFNKENIEWLFRPFMSNEFVEESKKIKFLFEDEAKNSIFYF